jgi:hypothetical protein
MPLTGLGLYGGYRGRRWLRNRIKIFKQFVLPSLKAQTNKNFVLWVSVRYEDINNPLIKELAAFLQTIQEFKTAFTYSGVCFWDDKYEEEIARNRLVLSIRNSMGELLNYTGESDEVLMTIQPSDDCYYQEMVEEVQNIFKNNHDIQAVAYTKGYVMDYINLKIAEWNPITNPPFFTIKFPRETFIDARKHIEYTGPYKSHEFIGDFLKVLPIYDRNFLVGTHGENISTIFNHPYTGIAFDNAEGILERFGLSGVRPLKIKISLRRLLMKQLPHGWQRKLRYWIGERFYAKFYDFIRG